MLSPGYIRSGGTGMHVACLGTRMYLMMAAFCPDSLYAGSLIQALSRQLTQILPKLATLISSFSPSRVIHVLTIYHLETIRASKGTVYAIFEYMNNQVWIRLSANDFSATRCSSNGELIVLRFRSCLRLRMDLPAADGLVILQRSHDASN